jgi:hypothetical protein
LNARRAQIGESNRHHLVQAVERLVRLYEGRGQKAEADHWRKELDAAAAEPKK